MTVLALISSIVIFDDAVAYAIDVVAVVAIDQSLVGTLWSDCLNNEWKGYCSRSGILRVFPNSKTKNDENYASYIFLHRTALRCVHNAQEQLRRNRATLSPVRSKITMSDKKLNRDRAKKGSLEAVPKGGSESSLRIGLSYTHIS